MAIAISLSGCDISPRASTSSTRASTQTLVLAASSLTEVGAQIAQAFHREHPESQVSFSFAGSSLLATQIGEGAPVDVFLSASPEPVERLSRQAVTLLHVSPFATNHLVLVVSAAHPFAVKRPSDLAGRSFAVCAPEVPCGAIAQPFLSRYRLTPVTFESDVKAVLAKVRSGEVDAGLIYRTDVDDTVRAINIDLQASTRYVAASFSPAGTRLVNFLCSPAGQQILAQAGFGKP